MRKVGIVLGEILWYLGRDTKGAHVFEINVYGKLNAEHSDTLREILGYAMSEIQVIYNEWGNYLRIRLLVPEENLGGFIERFVSDGEPIQTVMAGAKASPLPPLQNPGRH
ncbi:hypothetical protein CDI07_04585 [Thermococcus sp. 5-4]|nr:hypothetical protein CDI07_04585 [Thermococcus sp. 5-4]